MSRRPTQRDARLALARHIVTHGSRPKRIQPQFQSAYGLLAWKLDNRNKNTQP